MSLFSSSCDGTDKITDTYFTISKVCLFVKSKGLPVSKGCVVFSGPPREYLEYYIFPALLPGMAELLHRAQEEKCFEVRFQFSVQITGRKS